MKSYIAYPQFSLQEEYGLFPNKSTVAIVSITILK